MFDVEELVDIVKRERLDQVAVIRVPAQLQYVDYLVVTTGRSPKQMVVSCDRT